MSEGLLERPRVESRSFGVGALDRWLGRVLAGKLEDLRRGSLELVDETAGTSRVFGESADRAFARARLTVHRPRFYARALLGGSVGAGESYAEGDWTADDLTALVRIFVANREALNGLDSGWGAVRRPLERALHRLRRNSIKGSRENIRAHYDLGDDFFAQFLDETWMYSCGIFPREDSSLRDASTEKNDRICRKLRLTPADHLLEIGTGWGGFALHAAQNYGCRVTTTTISAAQHERARGRIKAAGLEGKITLLKEDYRNLRGRYDKLVSIEMIEAVGLENLDVYFNTCSDRLKPAGSMLLQSILIRDQYYDAARRSVDFIQKHIFPGSGIPSVSAIAGAVARRTDLFMAHQEDLTPHYARTLRAWSDRLAANREKVLALGYPETLYRLWQYYFGYCEGGFLEKSIGVAQFLFTKPDFRGAPLLGDL